MQDTLKLQSNFDFESLMLSIKQRIISPKLYIYIMNRYFSFEFLFAIYLSISSVISLFLIRYFPGKILEKNGVWSLVLNIWFDWFPITFYANFFYYSFYSTIFLFYTTDTYETYFFIKLCKILLFFFMCYFITKLVRIVIQLSQNESKQSIDPEVDYEAFCFTQSLRANWLLLKNSGINLSFSDFYFLASVLATHLLLQFLPRYSIAGFMLLNFYIIYTVIYKIINYCHKFMILSGPTHN